MAISVLKRPSLILLTCISVSIFTACQLTAEGAPATSQSGTDGPFQVDIELGPGSFDFPDPRTGLSHLDSYKSTLTITFDGTEDGQARKWSSTFVLLYNKEPFARTLTLDTTAQAAEGEPNFWAEMNGAAYARAADGVCFATVLDPSNSAIERRDPAASLIGVFGAEEAGQEVVNGVASNHYIFDQRALAQTRRSQSDGELWVAAEGGYLVRYLLTTTGDESHFGEGINGTFTWEYDLEVNPPITIQLPDDCPPGLVDAPLLPDASNVLEMPGILQYETDSSVLEARAFYEQELPKLGWQLTVSGVPEGMSQEEVDQMLQDMQQLGGSVLVPTPDPNEAFLQFTQGNYIMSVIISAGPTGTQVVITIGRFLE